MYIIVLDEFETNFNSFLFIWLHLFRFANIIFQVSIRSYKQGRPIMMQYRSIYWQYHSGPLLLEICMFRKQLQSPELHMKKLGEERIELMSATWDNHTERWISTSNSSTSIVLPAHILHSTFAYMSRLCIPSGLTLNDLTLALTTFTEAKSTFVFLLTI